MVHLVRFRAILNVKTETVAVRAERTDVSPTEEPRIVTIGIDRAIRRALADDPDLRKSVVNPGTVIDLINKEVVEAPAYVGPPIEVVRIDKNGPAWASKCFL